MINWCNWSTCHCWLLHQETAMSDWPPWERNIILLSLDVCVHSHLQGAITSLCSNKYSEAMWNMRGIFIIFDISIITRNWQNKWEGRQCDALMSENLFHFIFPAVILIALLLYGHFTDDSSHREAMHQIRDPLFNKAKSMFTWVWIWRSDFIEKHWCVQESSHT